MRLTVLYLSQILSYNIFYITGRKNDTDKGAFQDINIGSSSELDRGVIQFAKFEIKR